MNTLTKAEIQRFSHGLRMNIRDTKTGGRIESGWLHATIQWRGRDSIFLLTGQYPRQAASWTRIGALDGFGFRPVGKFNSVQRRRAKLARTLLGALQGLGYDDDRYIVSLETTCDRCEQPLASNVMVRPNGRVLGPTCWEIESGEFA